LKFTYVESLTVHTNHKETKSKEVKLLLKMYTLKEYSPIPISEIRILD